MRRLTFKDNELQMIVDCLSDRIIDYNVMIKHPTVSHISTSTLIEVRDKYVALRDKVLHRPGAMK